MVDGSMFRLLCFPVVSFRFFLSLVLFLLLLLVTSAQHMMCLMRVEVTINVPRLLVIYQCYKSILSLLEGTKVAMVNAFVQI